MPVWINVSLNALYECATRMYPMGTPTQVMRGVRLMTMMRHAMTVVGPMGYTSAVVTVSTAPCEGHAVFPHHHRRWWFPRCIHWVISTFYISWWHLARLTSRRCAQAWCFLGVGLPLSPFCDVTVFPLSHFQCIVGRKRVWDMVRLFTPMTRTLSILRWKDEEKNLGTIPAFN